MDLIILSTLIGLSVGLLFVPKIQQANFHLILQLGLVGLSGFWAVSVLGTGANLHLQTPFHFLEKSVPLGLLIDRISAFFILIIDFIFLMGCMYARGYLRPYQATKTRTELGWHYFNLFWLQLALILVVSTRGGMEFLISWELMSLSSFFLALFESEKKETLTIATRYLIQMHVGMVCILIGFLICYAHPGGVFGFADLHAHFQTQPPFWIFVLFFFGFGIKSGFLPFHGWLPQAHPAAPAHIRYDVGYYDKNGGLWYPSGGFGIAKRQPFYRRFCAFGVYCYRFVWDYERDCAKRYQKNPCFLQY
jgi:hydrogenase-4 component B